MDRYRSGAQWLGTTDLKYAFTFSFNRSSPLLPSSPRWAVSPPGPAHRGEWSGDVSASELRVPAPLSAVRRSSVPGNHGCPPRRAAAALRRAAVGVRRLLPQRPAGHREGGWMMTRTAALRGSAPPLASLRVRVRTRSPGGACVFSTQTLVSVRARS